MLGFKVMRRHETPSTVAAVLARHCPRAMERVLDPCVGNGALLIPLVERMKSQSHAVIAIDTDSRALRRVEVALSPDLGGILSLVKQDFLDWANKYKAQKGENEYFDCIVMNPPFISRSGKWRRMSATRQTLTKFMMPPKAPIEAMFVLAALELLRKHGRILAVLPSSIISAYKMTWLRRYLCSQGSILNVHELPPFTFRRIESRMYLLVFEKGGNRSSMVLMNHDIDKPECIRVNRTRCGTETRLDYSFHNARKQLASLRRSKSLKWLPIGELVDVMRGDIQTPASPDAALHTSNYFNGFWHGDGIQIHNGNPSCTIKIKRGDILVRRVSRSCAQTFGLTKGALGCRCTDCVLILRPHRKEDTVPLLFAVRCMMRITFSPSLIERGTGAVSINASTLKELAIPTNLHSRYRKSYSAYEAALSRADGDALSTIEHTVALRLGG